MNESSTPIWSDKPQECRVINYKENKDLVALIDNSDRKIEEILHQQYICVEEP